MRAASGHISAREVEAHIQVSKLKDLRAQNMTSKEMNLCPDLINLLTYRGIIKKVARKKEIRNPSKKYCYYNVYGPGPCYSKFCASRGWI